MLTPVIIDPENKELDSVASESISAMPVGAIPSGAPSNNFSTLDLPAASYSSNDFPFLSFSLHPSSSSASTASPPPPPTEPLGACGEFTTAYDSEAESPRSEEYPDGLAFGDCASNASSACGEIPRDHCDNGAAVARRNLDASHSLSAILVDWEISRMEPDGDSNASDASSEYGLAPRDFYFDGYEAVHWTV